MKNTIQVLSCILQHESISRIEISEMSNLSPSTVSQAVSALLECGIIRESSIGESTGGRKPIMLEAVPYFGCVITFEIKRSGVDARLFNVCSQLIGNETIATGIFTGNSLLNVITDFVMSVKSGKTVYPPRVVGIGLLCQDDIPDYDLNTEFSTSLSSDIIRLEVAVATRCGVPVKKDLINRYTLAYYLKQADANCANYAYINLGECITASFVLNHSLVRKNSDSIFDLSSAVLNESDLNTTYQPAGGMAGAQKLMLKRLSPEVLADKLAQVLKSALLFFPVDSIYIGGQNDNLDKVVDILSTKKRLFSKVHKVNLHTENANDSFAWSILMENCKNLIPAG